MEMNEEKNNTSRSPSISNLIASLEQATQMVKQLQITSNPCHLLQIYSSLQSTNTHLSSFLFSHNPSPTPPSAMPTTQNLQSDEPMEGGEDDEVEQAEQNPTIDRVEERFKDCFIGNKRLKRQLSPASADQRVFECHGNVGFDPYGTKIRALDLIYQFHA